VPTDGSAGAAALGGALTQSPDVSDLGDQRRARLQRAGLYLVCDLAFVGGGLRAALTGGVDIVQLRDKAADDDTLLEIGAEARRLCRDTGKLLIINDRPHVVVELDADGVHIGQEDGPVVDARAVVGEDRLVGLSTHTPEQIDAANRAGVDYIGVGPVYTTPTKPDRPAVGTELVAHAARAAEVPFFAIGDIRAGTVDAVVAAGATRVAVVRAITEAGDPGGVAHALRGALRREVLGGAA
jgi:thiamine-phosphate pyrophosphorylase